MMSGKRVELVTRVDGPLPNYKAVTVGMMRHEFVVNEPGTVVRTSRTAVKPDTTGGTLRKIAPPSGRNADLLAHNGHGRTMRTVERANYDEAGVKTGTISVSVAGTAPASRIVTTVARPAFTSLVGRTFRLGDLIAHIVSDDGTTAGYKLGTTSNVAKVHTMSHKNAKQYVRRGQRTPDKTEINPESIRTTGRRFTSTAPKGTRLY